MSDERAITPEQLRALQTAAVACMGWPFMEHGRGPDGIDCFGLLLHLQASIGRALPDLDYADTRADHRASIDRYSARARPVALCDIEAGDVVLFDPKDCINHCGVALGAGLFVHATRAAGVTIQRLGAQPWSRLIAGVYRISEGAVVA